LFSRESIIKKQAVEIDKTPKRLDVYTEFLPEVFLTQQEGRPEGAYYNDLRKAFVETLAAGEGDTPLEYMEEFSIHDPETGSREVSSDSGQAGSLPGQTEGNGTQEENSLLAEARQQADALLEDARVQAKKILSAQQQEGELQQKALEALHQEELTEARAQGRELGRQEGREEMEEGIRQVRGFYNMLERVWYDVLAGVDEDLLELALKISERIIGTVLKYDKEKLLSMIRSLILLPNERRNLKILVSETDWEWLRSLENKGLPPYPLVRDEGLKPGNVLIQSNEGIFDAQLETQLDKFREVLSEELINGQLESLGPKSQPH